MPLRTPWSLYDPIEDETYYLTVNPYEDAGSNEVNRSSNFESASGFYRDSLGNDTVGTIVFLNQPAMETFAYTGRTYREEDHAALETWAAKDYPVHLSDDLGRTWLVCIESFSPRRLPTTRKYPYKHEYSLTGFIIEEIDNG
jgi:hypothetical protein